MLAQLRLPLVEIADSDFVHVCPASSQTQVRGENNGVAKSIIDVIEQMCHDIALLTCTLKERSKLQNIHGDK